MIYVYTVHIVYYTVTQTEAIKKKILTNQGKFVLVFGTTNKIQYSASTFYKCVCLSKQRRGKREKFQLVRIRYLEQNYQQAWIHAPPEITFQRTSYIYIYWLQILGRDDILDPPQLGLLRNDYLVGWLRVDIGLDRWKYIIGSTWLTDLTLLAKLIWKTYSRVWRYPEFFVVPVLFFPRPIISGTGTLLGTNFFW